MANSNLFHIDEDGIRRTLAEANASLFRRRDALIEARSRMTQRTPSDDLNDLLAQLRSLQKEAKGAKISDGRSFNRAVKVVKTFFDELLQPVEESIASITREAERRRDAETSARTPIIATADGEIVCESGPPASNFNALTEVWEVTGFDRNTIDLNALRGCFSDYQIGFALKKHLEAHGPHALPGVSYERKLKPR
ncbi:MAG: hypothetical protein KAF27_06990 [Porphyrobacter sp.]|nr:hypothetical protein [Porphyrobacter sp.]